MPKEGPGPVGRTQDRPQTRGGRSLWLLLLRSARERVSGSDSEP